MPSNSKVNRTELGDFIRAYEAARADGKAVDLVGFLPPPDHPLYPEVHRQLSALDLEYRIGRDQPAENHVERTVWKGGRLGVEAESAADQLQDETTARIVVRVQRPEELGIRSRSAPRAFGRASGLEETPRANSDLAKRLAEALADMPAPGTDFLGFRLLAELGRGAFGRVYLAQQRDLASRYVALKVSTDILGESQALAQMQHTNIVPIYSVHRASPYQAVRMPYFGATTLADLLK